jgi:S23 ribosomal protein.
MQNYKSLQVWQKAHRLTVVVYGITSKFPKEETYALTSQLRRAISSVPANIAEGCGRNSRLDFAHFCNIALGSANEADYHLLLSKDLSYITEQEYINIEKEIGEVKAMLIALITKIRTS